MVLRRTMGWTTDKNSFYDHAMNRWDNERQIERLSEIMRAYFHRNQIRFKTLQAIKVGMVEDAEQRRAFEKGYLMSDIVETYRKAVVSSKKQMIKKRYTEGDRIRYMLYMQNAYIKVYHLVHMMHEINPKYDTDNTGQISLVNFDELYHNKTPTYWNTSGFNYNKELEAIRQTRIQEKQKKIRREKGIRIYEANQRGMVSTGTVKTTTNWWPVAYGWDIDYYW